ncbi:MAG: hypothetical protein IPL40_02600 [Proteobacteria bacterium]|nr:hypothetical protein [Pseudomonadota bacterium]
MLLQTVEPRFVAGVRPFARGLIGRGLAALALAFGLIFAAPPATAAVPPELRPATRAFFANFAIGAAIRVDDFPTQLKLLEEVGFHLRGGMEGPAIGLSLSQSFGDSAFGLQVGPKFWWDVQPIEGLGLYIAPMAQVGYALLSFGDRRHVRDETASYFDLQLGFEVRLAINDRAIVTYRPFTIDILAGEHVGVRYDMLIGGGVVF